MLFPVPVVPRVVVNQVFDYLSDKDIIIFSLSSKSLYTQLPQAPPFKLLNHLSWTRRRVQSFITAWLSLSNDFDMESANLSVKLNHNISLTGLDEALVIDGKIANMISFLLRAIVNKPLPQAGFFINASIECAESYALESKPVTPQTRWYHSENHTTVTPSTFLNEVPRPVTQRRRMQLPTNSYHLRVN